VEQQRGQEAGFRGIHNLCEHCATHPPAVLVQASLRALTHACSRDATARLSGWHHPQLPHRILITCPASMQPLRPPTCSAPAPAAAASPPSRQQSPPLPPPQQRCCGSRAATARGPWGGGRCRCRRLQQGSGQRRLRRLPACLRSRRIRPSPHLQVL
jgi:hypothetical protein